MKIFALAALGIGVLACSHSFAADLPPQFKVKTWKVDECAGVATYFGAGLYAADAIEIEEDGTALRIKTDVSKPRKPEPRELRNAGLKLINSQNSASPNVLKELEVKSLCAAEPEQFEEVFWELLADYNFELQYLAGVGQLHTGKPESTLIIFLPYVLAVGQPTQFIMAVIPRDHHHLDHEAKGSKEKFVELILKKKKNHNGIVHGSP